MKSAEIQLAKMSGISGVSPVSGIGRGVRFGA